MIPVKMEPPGASDETTYKLGTLSGIIKMHTQICSHMPAPYWYIDLNAGDGNGSPSYVYPHLERSPLDWTMVLIEHNPVTYDHLTELWENNPRIRLHCGDNATIARTYTASLGNCNGVAFHDPTGVHDLRLDALRPFSRSRIDIVLYYSATAHKRWQKDATRLYEILESGIKRYWLVRAPRTAWQWVFIIGTNWSRFPEWRRHQIYRTTSPEGRSIIERLHYTRNETNALYQPRLLEDV